jgi:GTP-binding protein
VAILGRPNVGKSTLVNRLVGRRHAIADEEPGVTRDRVEVAARWRGRPFVVVDTGGIVARATGLDAAVVRQARAAAADADLILLVVEAPVGITADDERLAGELRRGNESVLVVANKVDSEAQEPMAAEFNALGLGEPVAVSALHGLGSGELLDRIMQLVPDQPELEPQRDVELRFSIVGRPNVGKSSIFNRIVRQERAVVHDEAGTTRDAVDSVVEVDGRALRFIDTAGLRPMVKTQGLEYYGLLRSLRAMESAHVALLVVDASEGLTAEDKRIAARVVEAGRGLVVVLNKWDLVPSQERSRAFVDLSEQLRLFPGTPVLRTSARTGVGVHRIVQALLDVHEAWVRRIGTAEVNRVLASATQATPPPRGLGSFKYGTQASAGPPTFVLFGLSFPGASYQRYLEHAVREAFGFDGVPVRMSFRRPTDRRRARGGRGSTSSSRRTSEDGRRPAG